MHQHTLRQRRRVGPGVAFLAALVALIVATPVTKAAPVADPPPEVVAAFTQRVQPLVLNRCAAGACHGGERSPGPRFQRGPAGRSPDQAQTRANLHAFLDMLGRDHDPRPLAAMLAAGHPSHEPRPSRRAAPLSTAERLTLDRWLAQVRDAGKGKAIVDPGVVPVSAEHPEPVPPPNRFREMLDAAAHPPAFPPPQEPRGLIFKNDVPPEE